MKKQRWHLCLLACLGLAACASVPVGGPSGGMPEDVHGTFIGIAPAIESQLAEEAARHLARVYPPDGNLLDFEQEIAAADGFGRKLLFAAQNRGFFIRLSHVPGTRPRCGVQEGAREDGDVLRPVPVCYLVDDVGGLLRLTLHTAGEVWNRLFVEEAGGLRPAGAWTHGGGE